MNAEVRKAVARVWALHGWRVCTRSSHPHRWNNKLGSGGTHGGAHIPNPPKGVRLPEAPCPWHQTAKERSK